MKHQVFFFVVSLFCSSTFPMYRYNGPDRYEIIEKLTENQIVGFLHTYNFCMEKVCPGEVNEIGARKAIEIIRKKPLTFIDKVQIINEIEQFPYPPKVKKLLEKKYEALESTQ